VRKSILIGLLYVFSPIIALCMYALNRAASLWGDVQRIVAGHDVLLLPFGSPCFTLISSMSVCRCRRL
jgi:hypothetical protein